VDGRACGYTIIDPDIGIGAYKIAGGTNGGTFLYLLIFLALVAIPLQFLFLSIGFTYAVVSIAILGGVAALMSILMYTDDVNPAILAFARYLVTVQPQ
jgi:hypothetical protein